ncbi:MAG: hypothetical protein JWQ37_2607 [Blastococcus sp.]|jgi:uncharacterized membrane protein|nr:hypothetical protein [Blastococcus sp.]
MDPRGQRAAEKGRTHVTDVRQAALAHTPLSYVSGTVVIPSAINLVADPGQS